LRFSPRLGSSPVNQALANSNTDRAVLLWFYGGAASLEQAGYIYDPDGSGDL